jgi:hypothetical protein
MVAPVRRFRIEAIFAAAVQNLLKPPPPQEIFDCQQNGPGLAFYAGFSLKVSKNILIKRNCCPHLYSPQ